MTTLPESLTHIMLFTAVTVWMTTAVIGGKPFIDSLRFVVIIFWVVFFINRITYFMEVFR